MLKNEQKLNDLKITVTELKKCDGYKHLSDEEAKIICNTIFELGNIIFNQTTKG